MSQKKKELEKQILNCKSKMNCSQKLLMALSGAFFNA